MATPKANSEQYYRVSCPYHPEAYLIEERRVGDLICPECGLVVGDRVIDVGREWKSNWNNRRENNPRRVGGPENLLFDDCDLTTYTESGPSSLGYSGYLHLTLPTTKERAFKKVFEDISIMADKINLPLTVANTAHQLFKQVYESKSKYSNGFSQDAIASACLYMACRQNGASRSFKEIAALSNNICSLKLGRCFRFIKNLLKPKIKLVCVDDFVPRFCSTLGVHITTQIAALYIAQKAYELNIITGSSPISVAAAAIFMASQASADKCTKRDIRIVTGVAETTIIRSYKRLYPFARELFPKGFIFCTPVEMLPQV